MSDPETVYKVDEIAVGCDESLLPNCAGRKRRADAFAKVEAEAQRLRKQRAEKEIRDEEQRRREAKAFHDKCDKQEWELSKERNEEMWKLLENDPLINGGKTTTPPARRILQDTPEGFVPYKDRECEGLPKPKSAAGANPTTEGGQSAVGFRNSHEVTENIFQRVQAVIASNLLKKGGNKDGFDAYGRDLKKLRKLPPHEKRLSAEERGERYEHLTREAPQPYKHFREAAVSHNVRKSSGEVPVRSNESEGEAMEYRLTIRSKSADGRAGLREEHEHHPDEHYRHYRHSYTPRRVRGDGTPLLTEVGGSRSLDEYDDDDDTETSVEKKEPKKEKPHVDEGPGDGRDMPDHTQDEIDEKDGHDDYDQPLHRDNFDDDFDQDEAF